MLPSTFSFHEAYGKHRNPEEMRSLEKRDREALIRNYQVGDPVNNPDSSTDKAVRLPRESLLNRFASFVYTIQHVFRGFFSIFHPRPR